MTPSTDSFAITAGAVPLPLFMAATDQAQDRYSERPGREFERLVNADLRDRFAAGPAYKTLSRKENLFRWLQTLIDIEESIKVQKFHDRELLQTHPDKPIGGGLTPQSYADAKREIADRNRRRARTLQAISERIGEVRRLIGVEPVPSVGEVVQRLLIIDSLLRDDDVESAREALATTLKKLGSPAASTALKENV